MFQPLPAAIGLRYTKAKRNNHYISFISFASVFGIALGVIVLITVLSIMNGYVKGIQDRHLGMLSHVTVSDSDWSLPAWEKRQTEVRQNPQVRAVAPFIERQVMLKEGDKVHPTIIEAVLPALEKDVGTINRYIHTKIANGHEPASLNLLKPGAYHIILGETLAKTLGVDIGETITVLSPKNQSLATGLDGSQGENLIPIIKKFTVVGTFKVDLLVYDKNFAYIHMQDAAELFEMADNVTGLRVQIDDLFKAREVTDQLASKSSGDYLISNWTIQHYDFFRALQLQKTMLFLVLLLIIGVAAFNLISTLIMVVTDKQGDIAILKTLGMTPAAIMKIFIVQGSLLALIGTVLGVIVGLLLASNVSAIVQYVEQLFNTQFLNADIHGLTQIDAKIEAFDVAVIAISAFLLSIAATLFPAWKAAKVQPAEALRYE